MQENQTQAEAKEKDWTKNALISFDETAKAMVPRNFEGLWRMAEIMARSGMMPTNMEKPETVFVAVQMGLEVGLPPMAAVQNIAVINGRPSIWGDAVLGLVRSSGQLERFKESSEGEFPKDNFTAVCIAKRKGDPDEIRREFSIADAKRADLWCLETNDPKRKYTPWFKYPKRMLQMRARSWALRDGFGDVLRGLQMREEVQDIIDVTPDRNGKFTADDITEKLKANATETRRPVKMAEDSKEGTAADKEFRRLHGESAVPGEQPAAKAETKTEATTDGADNKTNQGPQPSAWDPYTAELQLKYGAKKQDAIKAELDKKGILYTTTATGRELHELLLDSLTPQGDEEEDEVHAEECQCQKCREGEEQLLQAAALKKLIAAKEAKRKAMYGNEPPPLGELKPPVKPDFDENAEQKMSDYRPPDSKADLRDKYIAILEQAGKVDRAAWMKSKQQVGLMSSPNVHTMPIEKLIEWATLAQSMTEGEKDIQFS